MTCARVCDNGCYEPKNSKMKMLSVDSCFQFRFLHIVLGFLTLRFDCQSVANDVPVSMLLIYGTLHREKTTLLVVNLR